MIGALALLALCTSFVLGTGEEAVSNEALLARAEQASHEGLEQRATSDQGRSAFRRAALAYGELRRRGAANPALFRNLATACYLADDLPQAILACRQGLRLARSDRALGEQLEAAREAVVAANGPTARSPGDEWPSWLGWLTPGERLPLAIAGWTLACFAFTRWRMTRSGGLLALAGFSLLAGVALAATLLVDLRLHRAEQEHPVVVLAQDGVYLRAGNGLAYPPKGKIPALNRGVEARMLFARGDWLQIELANGAAGWVRRDQVLLDVP